MMNAEIIDTEAPTARVVLDKPRTLRIDFLALQRAKRALKELRGDGAAVYDFEVLAGGVEATIAIVWGALRHEDPALTVEQVAGWLHPGNTDQITALMQRMIAEAMPEKAEASEGDADPLGSEAAA